MKRRILACGLGLIVAACESRVDPPPAPVYKPPCKIQNAAAPATAPTPAEPDPTAPVPAPIVDTPLPAPSLTDPDPKVRLEAAARIASAPEPQRYLPELIAALGDDDDGVRRTAELALPALGPSIVPQVVKLLQHSKASRHAFSVLQALGPAAREAMPALMGLVDDRDLGLQASSTIRKIGPAAVPALLDAIAKEKDIRRQNRFISILGGLGGDAKEAVPALQRLANDPKLGMQAKDSLNRIRPRITPVRELAAGLSSKDPAVRSQALRDLATLGAEAAEAVPALIEAYRQSPKDPEIENALRATGAPAFMPVLRLVLSDNETLSLRAANQIDRIARPPAEALPELLAAVKNPPRTGVRAVLLSLLAQFGPAAGPAVPDAVPLLQSSDSSTKAAAASFLGATRSPDAALPLAQLLKGAEGEDRRLAVHALFRLGAAASAAEPQVRKALQDDSREIRIMAEKILQNIEGSKR